MPRDPRLVGVPFEDDLAERVAEDMFGVGPEDRVRELRASVLGEHPVRFTGLIAADIQPEPQEPLTFADLVAMREKGLLP